MKKHKSLIIKEFFATELDVSRWLNRLTPMKHPRELYDDHIVRIFSRGISHVEEPSGQMDCCDTSVRISGTNVTHVTYVDILLAAISLHRYAKVGTDHNKAGPVVAP